MEGPMKSLTLFAYTILVACAVPAFAGGYIVSTTSTVKLEIDKTILTYAGTMSVKDASERNFVIVCMQMLETKSPGKYTLDDAFSKCAFNGAVQMTSASNQ
jgi:hypothetical protein